MKSIRLPEQKHCSKCNQVYDLNDWEPSFEIPKIMKRKDLCFICAFWEYQKLYDDTDRKNKGLSPLIFPDFGHWVVRLETKGIGNRFAIYKSQDNIYSLITFWNGAFQGYINEASRNMFMVNSVEITPTQYKEFQCLNLSLRQHKMESFFNSHIK